MDAVHRAAQIKRARAERIGRAASDEARQIGLAVDHLRRRSPVRPLGLALDAFGARPGEAFAADADAVAQRLAVAEHVIEERVRRIDDDGAGRLAGAVVDDLAAQVGAQLARALVGIGVSRVGTRVTGIRIGWIGIGGRADRRPQRPEQRLERIHGIGGSRGHGGRGNQRGQGRGSPQTGKMGHGTLPFVVHWSGREGARFKAGPEAAAGGWLSSF